MSTLSRERWQEISPYLDQALSLPEDERTAWLESFRAEKPEVAAFLGELLEEHRAVAEEHFLEREPAAVTNESSLAGQTIGAYRLISPIGQGGMGSVWLAERSDGRFERRVAVKFLHLSVARGGAERFKREGRILGQLAHPHIAELIDAGVTPNGEPYLVLELVEGEHVDEYCDKRELDLDARLYLFLDVFSAVAHAHANLIVHRDIKPSNVLVRNHDGQVKLLDFGIAKLLSDDTNSGAATSLTLEGGGALTPQFAAPEQVTGVAVTTATDVYELGVLLYLNLTGQHPAGPSPLSSAELVKAIVDTDPPRASDTIASADGTMIAEKRGTTPEKLQRQLRGDLDTILCKALKKNPQERYGSVVAFADDLRRYLKHEPISARPDSFTYRAGKFIRRNKIGVALAALAVIGTSAAVIAVQREARRAEYRFQQVQKLAHTVLFDVNPEIEQLAGSTKARELLVKTSLEYLDSLAKDAGRDRRLQLEVAEGYAKIGDVQGNPNYANLGHPAAALESYGKAAAIARKLGNSPDGLELLATAYFSIGTIQAKDLGLRSPGRENLRLAATIADSIPRLTGQPAYRVRVLSYGFLGNLDKLLEPMRAEEPLRRSVEIAREWTHADPGREPKFLLAVVTREWAQVLWQTGDLNAARDTLLKSIGAFREVLTEDQSNGDWLREQYGTEECIGLLSGNPDFFNLGERTTAAEWLQRAVDGEEKLLAADNSDVRARFDLSDHLAELAALYRESVPKRAEKLYQTSMSLRDFASEAEAQDSTLLYWHAFERIGFASLLQKLRKRKEGMDQLQHAINTLEKLSKQDPTDISTRQLLGVAFWRRASLQLQENNAAGGETDLQRSEQILEKLYKENPSSLTILRDLADCYREMGKFAAHRSKWQDARREYQKSLELWQHWTQIGKSSVYDQRQRELAASLVLLAAKHLSNPSALPSLAHK